MCVISLKELLPSSKPIDIITLSFFINNSNVKKILNFISWIWKFGLNLFAWNSNLTLPISPLRCCFAYQTSLHKAKLQPLLMVLLCIKNPFLISNLLLWTSHSSMHLFYLLLQQMQCPTHNLFYISLLLWTSHNSMDLFLFLTTNACLIKVSFFTTQIWVQRENMTLGLLQSSHEMKFL
jgi:hypothetical protein